VITASSRVRIVSGNLATSFCASAARNTRMVRSTNIGQYWRGLKDELFNASALDEDVRAKLVERYRCWYPAD
jgi:hypothetical protein